MNNEKNIEDLKTIDDLLSLFEEFGHCDYVGEKISQSEHAIQAALLAQNDKQEKEVIVAALLHDIGHVIGLKYNLETMGDFGIAQHDILGGNILRKLNISEKVCELVENHVKAKRYLVSKDDNYYNNLSEASKNTLIFQGGKLTKEECEEYEKNPNLNLFIQMRKYDEMAKVENMTLPKMSEFKTLIEKCVVGS